MARSVALRTVGGLAAGAAVLGWSATAYAAPHAASHVTAQKAAAWHVTGHTAATIDDITSVSKKYSYAVGVTGAGHLVVWHANDAGRTWKRVKSLPDGLPEPKSGAVRISAVSHSNAWVVFNANVNKHRRIYALHYNGKRWKKLILPTGSGTLVDLAAVGKKQVWVITNHPGGNPSTGAYYSGGAHWYPHTIAGMSPSDVSASSASDVWVGGATSGSKPVAKASRWNGDHWSTPSTVRADGVHNHLISLVAMNAHDVWAIAPATDATETPMAEPLARWDGSAWRTHAVPDGAAGGKGTFDGPSHIGSDGDRGVWLSVRAPVNEDGLGITANGTLWHHSVQGVWSHVTAPTLKGYRTQPAAVVNIPGTTQMLAIGATSAVDTGTIGDDAVLHS